MQWIDEPVNIARWQDADAYDLYQAYLNTSNLEEWTKYLNTHPPSPFQIAVLVLIAVGGVNSERARKAANIGHDNPGGSRDKQRQIQEIWATGKYPSRDACALQEYDGLAVTNGKARKDLRNTPNPNPWPANPKKKKA